MMEIEEYLQKLKKCVYFEEIEDLPFDLPCELLSNKAFALKGVMISVTSTLTYL